MRKLLAYFILLYQKKISPHKGYSCAHSQHHGGDSCSEYAKKQLLKNGVLRSLKATKQRFQECRIAATIIHQRPPLSQRGDCDFGLSGCDIDMCGGDILPSAEGAGNGCNILSGCNLPVPDTKRIILLILSFLLISTVLSYYFIGRQIESIGIRLKYGIEETTDSGLIPKLFNSQQPDYKINFFLKTGFATTRTLKNTSAKDWISLQTNRSFYLSDIKKIVIVNKEITGSKELESISYPQKKGKGRIFEYIIKQRWELF